MRRTRYFFAPLVGCFLWLGRVLGSVAMWVIGAFVWIFVGLAWYVRVLWNERRRAGSIMLSGLLAGLIGYAATILLLQFVFVVADKVAHAVPNVTGTLAAFRVR